MAMPVEKIEVNFEVSPAGGLYFTLDDPAKGVLDNALYTLAPFGFTFIDITDKVKSFSINRGRSSLFSAFPAGQLNVAFNNHAREFDPLYSGSPYAGNIVPKREIRATVGTSVEFTGWIEDWNFGYLPNGDSTAEAVAYDATGILSGQVLPLSTPVAELSGARINKILDQAEWSTTQRVIDTGQITVGTAVIPADTNVMNYLQSVATTEVGLVFIDKLGDVRFVDRAASTAIGSPPTFGGTGIPFQNLEVVYGSENLYNQVIASREGGGTATATDNASVAAYGLRVLSESNLLHNSDADTLDWALYNAQKFSLPSYEFKSMEIALHKLNGSQQNTVLGLEIGDVVRVQFTPNNIGDAIDRNAQIISLEHTVTPESHYVQMGFESI